MLRTYHLALEAKDVHAHSPISLSFARCPRSPSAKSSHPLRHIVQTLRCNKLFRCFLGSCAHVVVFVGGGGRPRLSDCFGSSVDTIINSRGVTRRAPVLNGYPLTSGKKYPDTREYLRLFWAGTRVLVYNIRVLA